MTTRERALKILYVTQFLPRELPICGAEVRACNVLRALQQLGTVDVAMLRENSETELASESVSKLNVSYNFEIRPQRKTGLGKKLRWTLDPTTYYPHGLGVGSETTNLLRNLHKYDLLWFFKSNSADMFPVTAWPRSVMDIDDVQSTYHRAILESETKPLKRINALRRQFVWQRRERLFGSRFTVLAVCTEEDRNHLMDVGSTGPIHVIPNGFDRPAVEPIHHPAARPTLGFIAWFSHAPNAAGIHWFVKNCWPRIKRAVPDACLRLAGPGSDGPLAPSGPDVKGLGWLANPSEEISSWTAMIVPIHVGAGTRIKIAQALSSKCPTVSTSFGALGYGCVNGREMLLADSPEAFAAACIKIIREPEMATRMAEAAWATFLKKWTWEAIRPLVGSAAHECLRLSGRDAEIASTHQSAATQC